MRFLIVVVGKDCAGKVVPCLDSIRTQTGGHEVHVSVTDDASTDGTGRLIESYAAQYRLSDWGWFRNDVSVGAMANQFRAWNGLGNPTYGPPADPADVVVFVDLDDRLAHNNVLNVLAAIYAAGATMTYGSYVAEPESATCPEVGPYPPDVVEFGSYRSFIAAHGGILHNHLRTVSWGVLSQITEQDCQDSRGVWWGAAPDFAVMVPCMELAGDRCRFIAEPLYVYSSDMGAAEWRLRPRVVNAVHQEILRRPPKVPVPPRAIRASIIAARNRRVIRPAPRR